MGMTCLSNLSWQVLALAAEMTNVSLQLKYDKVDGLNEGAEVKFRVKELDENGEPDDKGRMTKFKSGSITEIVVSEDGEKTYSVLDDDDENYEVSPANIQEKRDKKYTEILGKLTADDKIEAQEKVKLWEDFSYDKRFDFERCASNLPNRSEAGITDADTHMKFTPAQKLKIVRKMIHYSHSKTRRQDRTHGEVKEEQGFSAVRIHSCLLTVGFSHVPLFDAIILLVQVDSQVFAPEENEDTQVLEVTVLLKEDYMNDVKEIQREDVGGPLTVTHTKTDEDKAKPTKTSARCRISDFVFTEVDKDDSTLQSPRSRAIAIPCPLARRMEDWLKDTSEDILAASRKVSRRIESLKAKIKQSKKKMKNPTEEGKTKYEEENFEKNNIGLQNEMSTDFKGDKENKKLFKDSSNALVDFAKVLEAAWKRPTEKGQKGENPIFDKQRKRGGLIDLFFDMEPTSGLQKNPQAMMIACNQLGKALQELDSRDEEEDNADMTIEGCCTACIEAVRKMMDTDDLGVNNQYESKLQKLIADQRRILIMQMRANLKAFVDELKEHCQEDNLFVMIRPREFQNTKKYKQPICVRRDGTEKGLNNHINQAYSDKHLIRYFPLHDDEYKQFLVSQWGNPKYIYSAHWNWIPLEQVRMHELTALSSTYPQNAMHALTQEIQAHSQSTLFD